MSDTKAMTLRLPLRLAKEIEAVAHADDMSINEADPRGH